MSFAEYQRQQLMEEQQRERERQVREQVYVPPRPMPVAPPPTAPMSAYDQYDQVRNQTPSFGLDAAQGLQPVNDFGLHSGFGEQRPAAPAPALPNGAPGGSVYRAAAADPNPPTDGRTLSAWNATERPTGGDKEMAPGSAQQPSGGDKEMAPGSAQQPSNTAPYYDPNPFGPGPHVTSANDGSAAANALRLAGGPGAPPQGTVNYYDPNPFGPGPHVTTKNENTPEGQALFRSGGPPVLPNGQV